MLLGDLSLVCYASKTRSSEHCSRQSVHKPPHSTHARPHLLDRYSDAITDLARRRPERATVRTRHTTSLVSSGGKYTWGRFTFISIAQQQEYKFHNLEKNNKKNDTSLKSHFLSPRLSPRTPFDNSTLLLWMVAFSLAFNERTPRALHSNLNVSFPSMTASRASSACHTPAGE